MSEVLTLFGHATLGFETEGYKILIDPFFNGNPLCTQSANEVEADFILVTHGHGDHLGDTIEIARRTGATVISVAEIIRWLSAKEIKGHAQHLGGGFQHPFGYLKLTLALHGSALPDGSYGGNPCGFLLTTKTNQKIYFAGDTGLFGDMRLIGEEGVDLAVLPIGDNYTMGPVDALRAVKMLQPKHVVPMHYDSWDLIKQDAAGWCDRVTNETDCQAHLIPPGGTFTLD
ncbi:MAG: metal-dependent hydrolase [Anaerolineaceae bacterium]|nr:metal-dependent hydrolase [Anaerolineaceae bacterium]